MAVHPGLTIILQCRQLNQVKVFCKLCLMVYLDTQIIHVPVNHYGSCKFCELLNNESLFQHCLVWFCGCYHT